jgi:hypothetical protein
MRKIMILISLAMIDMPAIAQQQTGPFPVNPENQQAVEQAKQAKAELYKKVLGQPLQPSVYTWTAHSAPTILPRVDTHICLLSEVSGLFQGGGERVQLSVDKGAAGGPQWVLRGNARSGEVRARAVCAERAKFVPLPGQPGTHVASERPERVFSGCDVQTQLTQKNGYPALGPFLSTVGGKLAGGGEAVTANVTSEKTPVLQGKGCSGYVVGAVTLHGDKGWPMLRYRTLANRTIDLKAATFATYWYDKPDAVQSLFGLSGKVTSGGDVWMTPVDEALCGLTMVSGKFRGYGESIEIDQARNDDGRMWWRLRAFAVGSSSFIAASARCIARDQRGGLLF